MNAKAKCCWRLHRFVHHILLQTNCRSHRGISFHQPASWLSTSKHASNSEQQQISIPKRVQRSPTAILQALAETVDYDPTDVGQHSMIDDPGTLAYDRRFKMNCLLAEDSGRKAAQQAIDNWPELLQDGVPEPPIEAFTPPVIKKSDTEECLKLYITQNKVSEAQEIYNNMLATGTEVSTETKLMLLDLLCRYNCKDPDYYQTPTEKYFSHETPDRWNPLPLVDELFVELCDEHPQAYISMICGMCKYESHQKAHEMYTNAIEADILFPLEVHNNILTSLVAVVVSMDDVISEIQKILTYMENHGIRPNLETFNNILADLKKVPAFTGRFDHALRVVKEMKECGIEPSAASYAYLLDMVYRTKHTRHADLVKHLVDKFASRRQTHLRDPRDTLFLRSAMNAAVISNEVETAHRLYKLAWKGSNKAFLGNSFSVVHFHSDYLILLTKSEPIEEVMKAYTDIVPRCFIPNQTTYNSLLDMIELYGGYHYLPQIFQDMKVGNFVTLLDKHKFTDMLAVEHQTPQVYKQFAQIADELFEMSERSTSVKLRTMMTSQVFGNFIKLSLNMDDVEKAWYWFENYLALEHHKEGMTSYKTLVLLAEALIVQNNMERVESVLQAMVQLNFKQNVKQLITKHWESLASLQEKF